MLTVNIDHILEKQGRTRYWLAKEADVYYPNLIKLCSNNTSSISFDLIEKICKALKCTPNDILIIE